MEINAGEDNVGIKSSPGKGKGETFPRGRWCLCSIITSLIIEATAVCAVAFLFLVKGGMYERAYTLIVKASGG